MKTCRLLPANKDGTATTGPTDRPDITTGETAGIGETGKIGDPPKMTTSKAIAWR